MLRRKIFLCLFFLLVPLYSLPFVYKSIINNERYAFYLFAIFMGLIAYLFPPCGDFSRYYNDYDIFKGLPFTLFLTYIADKFDYLQSMILYLLGYFNLNSDYSRFIYTTISYILLSHIYLDIIKDKEIFRLRRYRRRAFFGFFLLSFVTFAFRFSFSAILFTYGLFILLHKRKIYGYFFLILSVLNHITFVTFLIPVLLHKISLFKLSRRNLILISLIAILLSNFSTLLLTNIPVGGDLFQRYVTYIDGYWSGEYKLDVSFKGLVFEFINKVTYYGVIIVYIFIYPKCKAKITKEHQLVNALLLSCLLFSVFPVIIGRFLLFLSILMRVFIFVFLSNDKIARKAVFYLCVITMIYNFMGVWSIRRELLFSKEYLLATSSIFGIFDNTYDGQWFYSNIGEDGSIMKIKYE